MVACFGLVRFNGSEFQIFDRRSTGGLIGLEPIPAWPEWPA